MRNVGKKMPCSAQSEGRWKWSSAARSCRRLFSRSLQRAILSAWFAVALGCWSCAREPCAKLSYSRPVTQDLDLAAIANDLKPKPRCSATDPGCGPVPVGSSDQFCYRPSAERILLPAHRKGEAPRSDSKYRCSHDGECILNGCSNACTSYLVGQIETECIGYDWLDDGAFCGCVQGECTFFRQ